MSRIPTPATIADAPAASQPMPEAVETQLGVAPKQLRLVSNPAALEGYLSTPTSDVAFTPAVKAVQTHRRSRAAYAELEARGGFRTEIDETLVSFLAQVDTAYLATANAAGQPYAQHRGGPKGFIRPLDAHTLAFADYAGNRQYVTTGNLSENDKAFLFLMDYAHRRRIKLWGRAKVVEDDPELVARLMPADYRARPEQAIVFEVEAWDVNCPQHIPLKLDAADVAEALARLQARIDDLERENIALKSRLPPTAEGDRA